MARLAKRSLTAKLVCLVALLGAFVLSVEEAKAVSAQEWAEGSVSTAVTSNGSYNPYDGKALIDGLVFNSSAAANAHIELRDSSDTAMTGTPLMGLFFFSTNAVTASLGSSSYILNFARPIRVVQGIDVRSSGCNANGNFCYSVLYRQVED